MSGGGGVFMALLWEFKGGGYWPRLMGEGEGPCARWKGAAMEAQVRWLCGSGGALCHPEEEEA
jgi:hypothetical protein